MTEALVIGLIVGGAVLFAVQFDAPTPPSDTAGAADLESSTWDAVKALDHMFYDGEAYANSTLSKVVADAVAGDSTNLTNTLDTFMPPGAQYAVYLNNGHDRIKLTDEREPGGQSVGVAYPFEPRWRFVYAAPDLEVYNSLDDVSTQGLTLIPLFHSNLVTDEGIQADLELQGSQHWAPALADLDDGKIKFTETAHTSLLQGAHDPDNPTHDLPSASVYLKCRYDANLTDRPCYAVDYTYGKADYRPYDGGELTVMVENRGPGKLAKGTRLTVELPVGFSSDGTTPSSADWTNVTVTGIAPNQATVRADLAQRLEAGQSVELAIPVDLTDGALDPRYAYKHVTAELSDGAVSQSSFLVKVRNQTSGQYTGGDARALLVSTPKPAGAGASADSRWGVVMSTPVGEHTLKRFNFSLLRADTEITSVSYPKDFDPAGATPAGSLEHNADTVFWNATSSGQSVPAYGFFELQFRLQTDGRQTPGSQLFGLNRPDASYATFDPFPEALQIHEGVWWGEHPPTFASYPGYSTGSDASVTALLDYRNARLTGGYAYETGSFSADISLLDLGGPTVNLDQNIAKIKDALQSANLSVDPARVNVGERVTIGLDATDLSSYLSQNVGINNMNLTSRIYAPWGVVEKIPVATYNHSATGGFGTTPFDVEIQDLDGDGQHDLLVAARDGTVYATDGATGRSIPAQSWSIPESASPGSTIAARFIDKARGNGVTGYGLATTGGAADAYKAKFVPSGKTLWSSTKHITETTPHAINSSMDWDGDGFPEILQSYTVVDSDAGTVNAAGESRIRALDGSTGVMMPGWEVAGDSDGFKVNGSADNLGMGFVGRNAVKGGYASTGMIAALETGVSGEQVETTIEELSQAGTEEEVLNSLDWVGSITFGAYDSGLVGFNKEGRALWNMSGGRFVKVMNASEVDTGGKYSGIVGGGGDGWVYGLSGEKAVTPVTGFEYAGIVSFPDVSMANELEGYTITGRGGLMGTTDGWTTSKWASISVGGEELTRNWPGVQAVDTIAGPYNSSNAKVAWFAGDAGMRMKTTDQLNTIDNQTGVLGTLHAALTLDPTEPIDLDPEDLTSIDLTEVNFKDVYAVSDQEAWFVGHGIGASLDGKGVIARTTDGGQNYRVTTITCNDLLGDAINCGLNGIDHDGEHLWVVGENGLVLVQDTGGMSNDANLDGSWPNNQGGEVWLNMTADQEVRVDTVRVDWEPTSTMGWMKEVEVDEGSGDAMLWTHDVKGSTTITPATSYDVDKGAKRNATLLVADYTNDGAQTVWDGKVTLKLGGFKKNLDPLLGHWPADQFPTTPINLTVEISYTDGSQDLVTIGVNEGSIESHEFSTAQWKSPAKADFLVPDTCFGDAASACADHLDVNVTKAAGLPNKQGYIVGEHQAPGGSGVRYTSNLYRFTGGATWTAVNDTGINETFRDAAVSLQDGTRALVVGDEDHVLATYTAGVRWTDMPKIYDLAGGDAAPLHGADFTHPDVPVVVGGSLSGLLWTVDGYHEHARMISHDLDQAWTNVDTSPTPQGPRSETYAWIGLNTSRLHVSNHNAAAKVYVDVLDGGDWATLHHPETGWLPKPNASAPNNTISYEFQAPQDEIKLRITFKGGDHGFTRFSPQLRGQLMLKAWETWDEADAPNWTHAGTDLVNLDLNHTEFFETGADKFDWSGSPHGHVRMPSVSNPWVLKLGNPDADYEDGLTNATGESLSTGQLGARVGDMDLSPDGKTLYVGTEGIYQLGQAFAESELGDDNTLYAIDVKTGTYIDAFSWVQFPHPDDPASNPDPIAAVRAVEDGAFVVTYDQDAVDLNLSSANPVIWRVDTLGNIVAGPHELPNATDINALEVARIFGPEKDDPVVALAQGDDGTVVALDGLDLAQQYKSNPAVKGAFQFHYDVPRNSTYGGHVIESRFVWTVTDDDDDQITQTARIHNAFSVVGAGKKIASSPTYTLEVVTWMEDWG